MVLRFQASSERFSSSFTGPIMIRCFAAASWMTSQAEIACSRKLSSHESIIFARAPQGGRRIQCSGGGTPVRLLGGRRHSGAAGGVHRRRTGRCSRPSCALHGAVASHSAHAGCVHLKVSGVPRAAVRLVLLNARLQWAAPWWVMGRALRTLDISCLREMLVSLKDTWFTMQPLLFRETMGNIPGDCPTWDCTRLHVVVFDSLGSTRGNKEVSGGFAYQQVSGGFQCGVSPILPYFHRGPVRRTSNRHFLVHLEMLPHVCC